MVADQMRTKIATVYLGCVPDTNQASLSNQRICLPNATIRGCGNCAAEIVYVNDAVILKLHPG